MRKFGVKLFSRDFIKNVEFVKSIEVALKEGKFGYLELYAIPESFDEAKDEAIARFNGVKTIIHAPHNLQGLDIADKNEYANNKKRLEASQQFADLLGADMIILHPGLGKGEEYFAEAVRQFNDFNDKRLIVENMPAYCSVSKRDLVGVTPSDIKRFMSETKCGFCLDFSHAICGANSYKRDIYEVLEEFKKLNPNMYHICDGDDTSTNDSHLHFGEGNYNLRKLVLDITTENAFITMETGHGIPSSAEPWLNDLNYINEIIK